MNNETEVDRLCSVYDHSSPNKYGVVVIVIIPHVTKFGYDQLQKYLNNHGEIIFYR